MLFNLIRKYLTRDDLEEIQNKIYEIEKTTSGELRLILRRRRGYNFRSVDFHDLALAEFYNLEMHKTKFRNGVLIMIFFEEKKFEIIGDEGIHSILKDEFWNDISNILTKEFREGNYKKGILDCLDKTGNSMAKKFPYLEGDVNELPDKIVIE